MKNIFHSRPGRTAPRAARWAVGITLAAFLAGGGVALATSGGTVNASGQSSAGASNGQLNALLSASGTASAGTASAGTASASTGTSGAGTSTRHGRRLGRLRALGGMYGSFTFRAKSGDETLAFERGTIETVTSSDIAVRAADGTTMTWRLVSDTVVRDHGKSATSGLSDGQLVFVGGPVVSGAHDARLVVVRTRTPKTTSVS
jgi:hypothetical protein